MMPEKYGLPEEYGIYVTSIKELTDKIREEDKVVLKDLEELVPKIIQYDGIISLNISKEYIKKRGFSAFKAIREIVQNSLDETELSTGAPDVTIEVDTSGIWITDNGRGLDGEAFIMGSSEKQCWMRGYYGEGLKLAIGFFLLKGFPVYIFSDNKVFKPVFLPVDREKSWLNILLGEIDAFESGTKILISGYNPNQKMLNELISFKNPDIQNKIIDEIPLKGVNCDVERHLTIYDHPNLLYMRNLLVGKSIEVTKRKSFFSYDVWWFRLDVSRNLLTYSMPNLFLQVAKAIEKSVKFRKAYAKKIIETGMIKTEEKYGGTVIEFNPHFSTFEGHLFVFSFPRKLLKTILKELRLEEKEEAIQFFAQQRTSVKDLQEAIDEGKVPFVSSSEIRRPLETVSNRKLHVNQKKHSFKSVR